MSQQFVLVPVEPTEGMTHAGWDVEEVVTPDAIWAAMLAAAPNPYRSVETDPPKKEHGDLHGFVMAWDEIEGWDVCHWRDVNTSDHTFWMPMLPDPKPAAHALPSNKTTRAGLDGIAEALGEIVEHGPGIDGTGEALMSGGAE